jgi:hypothetical protein
LGFVADDGIVTFPSLPTGDPEAARVPSNFLPKGAFSNSTISLLTRVGLASLAFLALAALASFCPGTSQGLGFGARKQLPKC